MPVMPAPWTKQFLELAVACQALRFGRFTLKSGRDSPYFFNAGAFCDGQSLHVLAKSYAEAIAASQIEFDIVFGPAYKGIPLAALVVDHLFERHGINAGFTYNRKEAKQHGEGGQTVGCALRGRVLLVDDVITAGTAIGESLELIRSAGAHPEGIAVALDRQERAQNEQSAVQMLEAQGLEVICLAGLNDLVAWLGEAGQDGPTLESMIEYRQQYGV